MFLFNALAERLEALEAGPKEFDTGQLLYRAETHTLQAIGRHPGINVTQLAEHMGVTKGAMSQMLAKLGKKGLVKKVRAHDNQRLILPELTALGWRGFAAHERFHARAFQAVQQYFGKNLDRGVPATVAALRDLLGIIDVFAELNADEK